MELFMEEIIQQQDCSDFMVKKRQQAIREILKKYKSGELPPEEKKALIDAMKRYRNVAYEENQVRAYNVLLFFYFAKQPLVTLQMPAQFNINKRTVFKDIDRGVKDLAIIMYGAGGLDLQLDEDSTAYMKEKLQNTITEQLYKELGQEVKNELAGFFKEERQDIIAIESRDNNKNQDGQCIREALKRIKQGNPDPGEREEIMRAMAKFKEIAATKRQKIAYDILFSFYLADQPLKTFQIADKYRINKRTVFKHITRGVEDLTKIMHGNESNPALK